MDGFAAYGLAEYARATGDQTALDAATDVIRWSLERGWDAELGGLFLACHLTGGTPRWHRPDAKVWWPHTEAFVALLRFHELTGCRPTRSAGFPLRRGTGTRTWIAPAVPQGSRSRDWRSRTRFTCRER